MSLLLQDILDVELEPGTVLLYTKRGDSFDEPLEGSCLMDFEMREEVNAG